MKTRLGVSAIWALCSILLFIATDSNAMPNFARKYEKNCSLCHTEVPKLNRTGFEFRLAGYRMPDEIGQKGEKFNLAEFFAARLQMQEEFKSHHDVKPGKSTSSNQLSFFEATLYPLTGSWGSYFGSLVELSMASGEGFEVENAYVRGVWGDEKDGWFSGKVGVMHPQEGFGASDRPLGNNRPLIQKQPSTGNPFYLWNVDEMAAEAGYYWPKTGTNLSARISNGVIWKGDPKSATDHADPAQGGALTKASNGPGVNHKNWQINLNQYINKDSGFSIYYYRGEIPFGDTNVDQTFTTNTFSRLAGYANWYVLPKKLNLLAGGLYGRDSLDDPSLTGTILGVNGGADTTVKGTAVGRSGGYFLEADYHAIENKLAFGARYDFFDPSKNVAHNSQKAVSIFANYHPLDNLQLIADLVHKTTEAGTTSGDNKDNQALIRLIFIY